ncbi:MAG: hypothetical protein JWR72_63 [Flavisolibacter sp.]|jgi:uncharacterized protein (DUF1684 family)|nr:hypothetical protein [Flavisolibacter sp.]
MKTLFLTLAILLSLTCFSQASYKDSIVAHLKNYVQNHTVVKGHDKDHMKFYEVDEAYKVIANFKTPETTGWITFKTSGKQTKVYRLYGTLSFLIGNETYRLNVYQSQDLMTNEAYKNYLFLPFTDATTGTETYSSGRYLDLTTDDIKGNKVVLDFNKAYNPYCAYVTGIYNCPIPPKENTLPVAIKAGEKNFTTSH